MIFESKPLFQSKQTRRSTICVVTQFNFMPNNLILSFAEKKFKQHNMQIQNTSFITAEEIVTIKMLKAIYTQQFALSLTHLIAKQIQNFVTRNRKLSNNIEANSKHQLFSQL